MNYAAVAFDIDGTLYPDLALRRRILPFAARNLRFLLAFSAARDELHARAASGLRDSETPTDLASFRSLQARLTAERLGWAQDAARKHADDTVYTELEESFSRVRLFRGVVECLEALKSSGLALAILSDFPARRKLEALGIGGYFQVARCSEESGLLKPAREPFLALAAELGLKPSEILYVGNSLVYDVAGATAAGMTAALRTALPRPPRGHGAHPDFAFSSWKDLQGFVLTRTTRNR